MAMHYRDSVITHGAHHAFDLSFYQNRLKFKDNLALSLEEENELLVELASFEWGRFLLLNQGLNGYWTAYALLNGLKKEGLSRLERWMLHRAPVIKATQERYAIFKQLLQSYVQDHRTFLSVPCGLMDDLLSLGYSNIQGYALVGIDLDSAALELAHENSLRYAVDNVSFIQANAWHLKRTHAYDVITSNGLNIYEPDHKKVVALYQQFYQALKPGGVLITSFLTPPPQMSKESSWVNYNAQDVLKQKAIFTDIIETQWQVYRTEHQTHEQLEQAGFCVQDILYDAQGMFPTVLAKKIEP
ncbi:MAG: class I SAM-dependent methyltransferase [Legionellaceae bacterium]